jgi:predicted GIY-YIG superfamily endonuclease
MNVIELVPAVSTRVEFSLRASKNVPDQSGCYVLTNVDGTILYIGLSCNLRQRFGMHRDDEGKRGLSAIGRAFWFYYCMFPERELHCIERTWQNQHLVTEGALPAFNKIASPVS